MRTVLPLTLIASLVAASPAPLSPSTRQTPYDIKFEASDGPSYNNKHPECGGILEPGCGPLHLGGSGILAGDSKSGVLGAQNGANVAGVHIRGRFHPKKDLLSGIRADALTKPVEGLNVLPSNPLQGLGLKRSSSDKLKRIIALGRPDASPLGLANGADTCAAANKYCCKHVRKYSDPRNANVLDGGIVQDGLLNDVLVGLTCDLISGTLAPSSCANRVCCTSQRETKGGQVLHLGCTPLAGSLVDI